MLVKANEEVDEAKVRLIENAGIDRVKIRSVLTCQAKRGICVECYGRDLARGRKAHIGEAVGVIAAQSIGEPGTQLTMRTFHIGGTASRRAEQSTLENRNPGLVHFHGLNSVKKKDGSLVVMNRNGELIIQDESGRERERYPVVYGAKLLVKEGQKVEANQLLAEWDPYAMPMLTEVAGTVKFGDVIEGVTMNEQLDEVTGLSRKVIIESRDPDARPRISIQGRIGTRPSSCRTPSYDGALLSAGRFQHPVDPLADGDFIEGGGRSSPRSRARPTARPRTSPVVCRGWPSSSKLESRRRRRSFLRSMGWSALARTPRESERSW